MKRKLIYAVVLAAAVMGLSACDLGASNPPQNGNDPVAKEKLYPIWKTTPQGKVWGYMNKEGKVVVAPEYEMADFFSAEGTAVITKDGKKGIISEKGTVLLKPVYDSLKIYPKNRWIGIRDGSWTEMVDGSGKAVYETGLAIHPMAEGGARIQEYVGDQVREGYIDDAGTVVIEPQYISGTDFLTEKAVVKKAEGAFAIIDPTGKVLSDLEAAEVGQPSEGTFAFAKTGKNPLWGYMDLDGKVVIKPAFAEAQPFNSGIAVVGQKQKGVVRYGLIDVKGKFILHPKYARIEDLGNGFYAISREVGPNHSQRTYPVAIFNSAGKRLTDYVYYDVAPCTKDMVSVSDGNETWLLDSKGVPMSTMPRIAGMGTIRQEGDLLVSQVEEERAYFTMEGKLLWETPWDTVLKDQLKLKRFKFRPDRGIVIYYPALEGLDDPQVQTAINNALYVAFIGTNSRSALEDTVPQEIVRTDYSAQLNKDILIVERTENRVSSTDGSNKTLHRVMHINIRDGSQYGLIDLFRPESDWSGLLAEKVKAKAAAMAGNEDIQPLNPELVMPVTQDRQFVAGRYGLVLYYESAELGGLPGERLSFEIPYADMLKDISTEGAMWNAFLKQDM